MVSWNMYCMGMTIRVPHQREAVEAQSTVKGLVQKMKSRIGLVHSKHHKKNVKKLL